MKQEPLSHEIYTVSQLNEETRLFLEEAFQIIWLTGEISNLAQPSSGHIYFSLKDENAQVRCAFFRNSQRRINFKLENGQQILVQAQVSLYEARGEFQLIVQHMELAGGGALQIAFEQLKKRLASEGLFDEAHKKPIPQFPKKIGVITSSTGAAIHDILTVLKRRFASIPVVIYPTLVQGATAAGYIAEAIQLANLRDEADVLILARGGGSLEDLWPFNEEIVARAIFKSKIPIVTGIGHEIDFTIADFVADLRAPTPSAAAEHVSPDKGEWLQYLKKISQHLIKAILTQIKYQLTHLHHLQKRLRHPGQRVRDQMQALDQLEQNLKRALKNIIEKKQSALQNLSRALYALSPTQTLERGYAIITLQESHEIIRNVHDVAVGDKITARLARGQLDCSVEHITE